MLKFKPLDDFFPFQNVMANLSVFVATSVCVCVHPLNKDVFQAILALFISAMFKR